MGVFFLKILLLVGRTFYIKTMAEVQREFEFRNFNEKREPEHRYLNFLVITGHNNIKSKK